MPFPNGHLYLTAHWTIDGTFETGQFGLRFDSTAPASSTLVGSAAARLATMWGAATMTIPTYCKLVYARLAALGPDGLYVPGTPSYDFTYSTPVAGTGGLTTLIQPLQLAHVMTLRTALPRGRAHVGRVYLPPMQQTINSNYQWPPAATNNRNNTFAAMCSGLNTDMPGPLTIFSRVGTGTKQVVTFINSDPKPDVQRRRAKQLTSTVGIPATV
jgi:hypothetical protein